MTAENSFGQRVKELASGTYLSVKPVIPSGSLTIRKLKNGAGQFYWRYTIGGKTARVPIGIYDSSAPPKSLEPTTKGFSLAAANRAAEVLAQQHNANLENGGLPALVEQRAAEKDRAAAAMATVEREALAASSYTLRSLLNDYCDNLQRLGRISHTKVRNTFKNHVFEAWPDISDIPAKEVTGEQIADMMRRVLEAGKGRTSNRLRSYIRAAYQTARSARSKASVPANFKAYNIVHNPAAETEPDESQNRAAKSPLSTNEMSSYWKAIQRVAGFKGAVLRFHILTGGQRIEQLVRLRTADIGDDSFVIHDGKGRPGQSARPHRVPLTRAAALALKQCDPEGEYAISMDGGLSPLSAATLSRWAKEYAVGIVDFQAKRIRSGVETLLASVGVSKDIRGRLQSHGISGIQDRHYDGHEYMHEKREALELLRLKINAKK